MAKQTWIVPLEARTYTKEEEFNLGIYLDGSKRYEVAASSIYFHITQKRSEIGTLYLDIIDSTRGNPNQILTRISKTNNVIQHHEYYKIDKKSLNTIRLQLTGLTVTSLAVTLIIREV
jgi:hypothetical protein